ncbi:MAG TPA: AsmA family protein [Candidatus Polarisedimenticolia bacterium]|nr:AsmA family protein [Candidatus Polarisedimenticolia bacterium]
MSGARTLKWGLGIVAAVVVTLIAAVVLLPLLIDVNRYAPLLSAQTQSLTGRAAKFGPMTLRVLPAPALHVAPVSLAEGARYPGRDFIRIESIDVRLRLLPLFRGRVEFGTIVLDRPTVTVIRDRQGRWNFDDLLERTAALRRQGAGAAGAPPTAGAGPTIGVGEAVLRGGRLLVYDDAVVPGRRSELTVGPIDARLAGFGLRQESDADLSLGLGKSRLAVTARLSGDGEAQVVEAKIDRSRLETADLVPLIPWLGVARPAGLQVGGGADVEGKATVPLARPETLQFDGTITLDNLHYKDAGMTRAVEKVGGRLKVAGDRASWEGFTATVGKSDLSGTLTVEDYLRPRVGFALTSKRLDLNELVALYAPAPAGRAAAPAAPAAGGSSEADLLSQVSAAGTLKADALRFQTFDLADVKGKVTLKDGVANLSDLDARIADGTIRGSAGLDLGRPKPGYRLEAALKKVDVNALATAYDPGLKDLLRGRLGGELSLAATGTDLDAILSSARGNARIEIADGAVTSISILKQLASLLEMAGGKGIGKDETPFDMLRGNFAIGDRRAATNDLSLDSKDLDLAGIGHVGLDASLDLAVTGRFSEEASRGMIEKTPQVKALADSAGIVTVHLLARGPLAAPQVGLNTRAQVRQVQEQKKEQIKEKVRDRLLDYLGGGKKKEEPPTPEPTPPPPPPR